MPILPRETDLFPNGFLDIEDVDQTAESRWWVLYTLSRREKELMRRLIGMEVPFYCPLIARKNRSPSGRVRTSHVPLFPGYVFCWATPEQRQLALTTNCISRTLPVVDHETLVHDLRQIRRLIESDTPLSPESRIQPGALVRVKNGPMMGIEGVVLKRRNGDRLLVSVQFLQQVPPSHSKTIKSRKSAKDRLSEGHYLFKKIRSKLTLGMLLRMLADAALLSVAMFAAVAARFLIVVAFEEPPDVGEILRRDVLGYCCAVVPLTLISLTLLYGMGVYTYRKYYLGKYKLLVLAQAISLSYLGFGFVWYFFSPGHVLQQHLPISRAAYVMAWLFSMAMLAGARFWNVVSKRIVEPERQSIIRANRKERHVLVIGGAGYIGSALLPELLERGHHVRVLDLLLFGKSPIEKMVGHPRLELVHGDFRHVQSVVEAMRDIDTVVHLGAIVGDPACNLDEDLTIDVNLSATRVLAQLAQSANVDRFLFASTCSVYGACDEVLDERSEVRPVALYGHTKLAAENVLLDLADERFLPTILRFATIYGLSGRTRFDLVVNLMTAQAKLDNEITVFGGEQWRPFVHVKDAAHAVALVLDAPKELVGNQIFNVGSDDQNHTILQIAEMVHEQVVGSELKVSNEEVDARNYRISFAKINQILGFTPSWTVRQGIQQVIEAIASGEVADYRDPQHSNVRFLTEEGTSKLARDRWARELIRSLSSR